MEKKVDVVSFNRDVFKERLNALMAKKNMRKIDLSRKTDIIPATIGNYVDGKRLPNTIEHFTLIAKALDTSLDYLVGITNVESPASTEPALDNYEDAYRLIMQLVTRFQSSDFAQREIKSVYDNFIEESHDELIIRIVNPTLIDFVKKEQRITKLHDVISPENMGLLLNSLYKEMNQTPLPSPDRIPWEE